MLPYIAAFIFSIFILAVFIIDLKRKPNLTYSHWIPFIWFLIVSSRPIVQWFDSTSNVVIETTDIRSSPLDATVLTILIVIGIFLLFRRWENCSNVLRNNLWLIILTLYCFISISWSDYPSVSFKRWIRGFGTLIMVLVVLTEIDPLETVRTMFRRCAFLNVPLSVLFIKYFRDIGVYYESYGARGFAGITTGKNPLGRLCLILGTYFVWEIFINWKNQKNKNAALYRSELLINLIFVIMIFWLLIKADSATSLGCLIIGVSMLLSLTFQSVRENINFINITSLVLVLMLFLLDLELDFLGMFVKSMGRDVTLTGRTEIWSLCFKYVENPLIGVGYDSFWIGNRLGLFWDEYSGGNIIQAHNGYIDAYLQIGIIGLFFLAVVMLSIYCKIRKTLVNDFELGCFQFIIFIQFLIYNITEDAVKLQSFFWFAFLLVELIKIQSKRPVKQEN